VLKLLNLAFISWFMNIVCVVRKNLPIFSNTDVGVNWQKFCLQQNNNVSRVDADEWLNCDILTQLIHAYPLCHYSIIYTKK